MNAKKPKAAKIGLHSEVQFVVTDIGWEVESIVTPQLSSDDGWGLLCWCRTKLGNKAEIWGQAEF